MSLFSLLQQLAPGRSAPSLPGTIEERVTPSGLSFVLYLPEAETPERRYPVLYHLHGAMQTWAGVRHAVQETAARIEAAAAAGHCPRMIIAAPHDLSGISMWADSPDGRRRQASDIDTLIEHIDALPQAKAARSARFVQGFSMGGFGAASLALRQPERFGGVIVWDGAMHDWGTLTSRRPHIARRQFHNDPAHFARFSPWQLAQGRPQPGVPFFIVSGALNDYNRRYAEHIAACGGEVIYRDAPVGHSLHGTQAHFGPEAYRFLGKRCA